MRSPINRSDYVIRPTARPITVATVKSHLRIDGDDENARIEELIDAATDLLQEWMGRQFMPATRQLVLDDFPPRCDPYWIGRQRAAVALPYAPLVDVVSVTYIDTAGDQQTVDPSIYEVFTTQEPGQLVPRSDQAWPDTVDGQERVTIQYQCGYPDDQSIPPGVALALTMITGTWYCNREASTGRKLEEIPGLASVRTLLEQHRVRR